MTTDHVALLCRKGLIAGVRTRRQWFVDADSLSRYFSEQAQKEERRRRELSETLSEQYRKSTTEVRTPGPQPVEDVLLAEATIAPQHTHVDVPAYTYAQILQVAPIVVPTPVPAAPLSVSVPPRMPMPVRAPQPAYIAPRVSAARHVSEPARIEKQIPTPVSIRVPMVQTSPERRIISHAGMLIAHGALAAVFVAVFIQSPYLDVSKEGFSQAAASVRSVMPTNAPSVAGVMHGLAAVGDAPLSFFSRFMQDIRETVRSFTSGDTESQTTPIARPAGSSLARAASTTSPVFAAAQTTPASTGITRTQVPTERLVTETVIERIVSGVTQEYVEGQINELRKSIAGITARDEGYRFTYPSVPQVSQTFVNTAITQRIDYLAGADIEDSNVARARISDSFFTGGVIEDSRISANWLSVSATTTLNGPTVINGSLTSTGGLNGTTLTLSGNLQVGGSTSLIGASEFSYFNATSTATSSSVTYRLGIGTTSPYATLAVEGDSALGNSALAGYFTATTSTATSTFAGALGIGTTSPSSRLAVQGGSYISGPSFFGGAITATSTMSISGAITSTATTPNTFPYASSTALTVSGTGYFGTLGVGTSSPSTNFSVQGNGLVSGTFTAGDLVATSSLTISGLAYFQNGFISSASSTIGDGTQIGGLTVSGGATTTGNQYIGGNLRVGGNSTTIGNSTSNTLIVNSSIQSHLVPDQNITYDLGSASFYWRNVYVGNLNANNISAASTTISGTNSQTFTLNADNATSDTEDQDLIFFRGNVVPNALLSWKSSPNRFEFNQPLFIQNASTDNLAGITLDLKGIAGQTGNLFQVASSTGTNYFNISNVGNVGIGTTSPSTQLAVQGGSYISGTSFFGGAITATSTLSIEGAITSTATSANTFPYASSTALTVSGTGYFGTASTTNLTVSALTSGRVPYITTGGVFADSANLTFNGTTLTANTLALSNALTVANGGTGAATFTNNRLLTGNGTSALVDEANLTFDGSLLTLTGNASTTQLSSTGSSYFATGSGNVGIGTTTPAKTLSVQGDALISGTFTAGNLAATSTLTVSGVTTLSGALTYGGVTLANSVTGTGSMVLSTSPTLTTPILGTPQSITLTNGTGLPISTGVSGLGTGVATALAVNVGSAGAFITFNGALGTPSSGTLTNATGLPIGTGVSGLGTGVATFLATPSSANLISAVTDETGSGSLVFATAPAFVGITNSGAYTQSGTSANTFTGTATFSNATYSALFTGGNVGIGTTEPAQTLQVVSGTNFQARIGAGGSFNYDIGRNTTDGLLYFYGNQSGFTGYSFGGADGTRMVINSSGNVGIGTTTPVSTSKLTLTGTDAQLALTRGAGSATSYIGTAGAFGTASTDDLRIRSDGSNILFGFSGTETARFTSGGLLGIGTTTPSSALHVNTNNSAGETRLTVGAAYASAGNDNGVSIYTFSDGSNYIDSKTKTNGITSFRTGHGTELGYQRTWMNVNASDGAVGIGTTFLSQSKLTVGGSLSVNGSDTNFALGGNRAIIDIAGGYARIGAVNGGGSAMGTKLMVGAGTEAVTILSTGLVGIGKAPVTAKLEVVNTVDGTAGTAGSFRIYDNLSGIINGLGTSAGSFDFRSVGNFTFFSGATPTEYMRLTSAGLLGIGTTSPTMKLSISDSNNWSNLYGSLLIADSGAIGAGITLNQTGSGGRAYSILSTGNSAASGGGRLAFFDTTSSTYRMIIDSSGNVGIGTTSPQAKLHVAGGNISFDIGANNGVFQTAQTTHLDGNVGSIGFGISDGGNQSGVFVTNKDDGTYNSQYITFKTSQGGVIVSTERMRITEDGKVGVGTTTPFRKFSITDTVATAQMTIAYDTTRYTDFQTNSVGDLIINPQGDDAFMNDDNLWICTGGSCPAGTPSGTGNLIVESRVGVGTTTPTQQLSVANLLYVGAGGATGMGTATSTFQGDIRILGKLDVSTIDPVYTIDGVKYATYGHSTIGIKEETVATFDLAERNEKTGYYEKRIEFATLEEGSDLWLFYQVTDFGDDWKSLVVTLTPSFDGRVFYKKLPGENALLMSSTEAGEVSARLIADRYDSAKWPNLRPDQDDKEYLGHVIDGKPASNPAANPISQPAAAARALQR